jgi:peptidoglycan L-alanyl-D-glutamate endopeptidase CwlK
MDAVTQSRLIGLHPLLVSRYTDFDTDLTSRGIILRITQALRSWSDQDALYAIGRTVPGKIVTEAKGGYSAHCFGYAVDVTPNDPAFPVWKPDWNENDDRWKQVLSIAENYGLKEGAQWRTFPDFPHLYLAELPPTPTDAMRALFLDGGIAAVWNSWDFTPRMGVEESSGMS